MRFERGNNLPRVRVSNQVSILRMIYYEGPICRSEIAGRLGLTLPTITSTVSAMIADGLVRNVTAAKQRDSAGRRADPVEIVPDARHFVGIESTGMRRAVCVCDYRGEVICSAGDHESNLEYWNSLEQTARVVRQCLKKCGLSLEQVAGIGMCVPGLVDCQKGVLNAHPLTNWKDKAVQKDLSAILGYNGPIALENNACARATGAQLFHRDVLGDAANFTYLFVDYGMACPLFLSTSSFMGSVVGAGEVGHMIMEPGGRRCSCGNRGCLEAYSSDAAVIARCAEALSQGEAPLLRALCRDPARPSMGEILEAQRAGDPGVCRVVDEAIRMLGIGVSNLINFSCPEVMLIECKLFSESANRQRFMEVANSNLYNVSYTGVKFAFLEPDEYSGARSAAVVAINADLNRYAQGQVGDGP